MTAKGWVRPARGERGFILVTALWILAALAMLASVYSVYVGNAAFATHVNDDRLRIRASVLSALELSAYEFIAAPSNARPPQGAFAIQLARSKIDVKFVTEGARVNLNSASKEMLAGLFAAVGASASDAATYADRVLGWRDKGVVAGQNREAALYKAAGYAYPPRQAPFVNVLELSLVLDLPTAIVDRVLPFVTIFSGQAEIDVRVADHLVLSALPKATPDQIRQVLAQRANAPTDGDALLTMLGPARGEATATTSPAMRVRVDVLLDDGRHARSEVVILVLWNEDEPFRVLSSRDDVE